MEKSGFKGSLFDVTRSIVRRCKRVSNYKMLMGKGVLGEP